MKAILATLIAGAALFTAAGPAEGQSISVSLSPNHMGAASTLTLTAQGPFSASSGQLSSASIIVQPGFMASARSVSKLCSSAQAGSGSCPASSKVGGGQATATGSEGVFSIQDALTFSLFLAHPAQRGDIASVVIEGSDTAFHQSVHVRGRLFKTSGGALELLFDQLPQYSLPSGAKVTVDGLTLHVHAVRRIRHGKRRRRYSLITNPKTCTGSWGATVTLTFTGGAPYSQSVSAPCRRG